MTDELVYLPDQHHSIPEEQCPCDACQGPIVAGECDYSEVTIIGVPFEETNSYDFNEITTSVTADVPTVSHMEILQITTSFTRVTDVGGPSTWTSEISDPAVSVTDTAIWELVEGPTNWDTTGSIGVGETISFVASWQYHADAVTEADDAALPPDGDCCIVGPGLSVSFISEGYSPTETELAGACGEVYEEPPPGETTTTVVDGVTQVHLPMRVLHFAAEECPCGCNTEVTPCDCDGIDWYIWGNMQHRRSSHSGDPFSGSLWYYEQVDQGVVYAPYTDVDGTHYPFEIHDHDAVMPDRLLSSMKFGFICSSELTGEQLIYAENTTDPISPVIDCFGVQGFEGGTYGSGYGSFECSPDHWFLAPTRYNLPNTGATWGTYLVTTRFDRLHVPDPDIIVPACCDRASAFHPCPPAMRMTAGGWSMDTLIRTVESQEGTITHVYSSRAESSENQAWEAPKLTSQLESGLALLPGWGPSTIPNIRGYDISNPGESASLSWAVTIFDNPLTGGPTIVVEVGFSQLIVMEPIDIPGHTYRTVWGYRTNPPIRYNLYPGDYPCGLFPLTVQVGGFKRIGNPIFLGGPIITALPPLSVTFSFIS